jgi:hypothetical protein
MGRGVCSQEGGPGPTGHHPLTGMQKDRGTIHPAPPSMQKRNTGIAQAGCVCLLQAPGEGNTGSRTLPSRFGMASLSVQNMARLATLPLAGAWNALQRSSARTVCTPLASYFTLTAQPLRAGD